MAHSDGSVIIDVKLDQAEFQNKLKSLSKASVVALAAIGTAVAGLSVSVINVGKEFESAFAGVRKTVEATEEEFAQFKSEILDLSTVIPLAAKEIAGIAEAAGQLGIKNENLMKFTKTMADIGVSTDMSANEAATAFARFANITEMAQENFDRLGSSTVALGNNMATTESEIINMALRLAGAAKSAGFTESQMLALSSALSSVGMEAQAGGGSMSRVLNEISISAAKGGDAIAGFAKVAGLSAEEFAQKWKTDAASAFDLFIQGLGKIQKEGGNVALTLQELGINETIATTALTNLAGSEGLLSNALRISSEAWEENIALTNEAAQRYETTESKMQMLSNSIEKAGILAFDKFQEPFKEALDAGIESVGQLTDSLTNGRLGKSVDNIAQAVSSFAKGAIELGTKALPVVIDGASWLIDNHKLVVNGILAVTGAMAGMKAATNISNAKKGITEFASDFVRLNGKINLSTISAKAFKLAMSPAGIGLIVGAVAALTVGIIAFASSQDTASQKTKALGKEIEKQRKQLDELNQTRSASIDSSFSEISLTERYYELLMDNIDAEGRITGSKEDALYAIDRLNEALGTSITLRDDETVMMDEQIDKISQLIDAKRAESIISANQDLYNKYLTEGNDLLDQMISLSNDIGLREEAVEQVKQLREELENGVIKGEEFKEKADEIAKSVGEITADGLMYNFEEDKHHLEDLKGQYNEIKDAAKLTEEAQRAISTGDYTAFNDMLSGLDELMHFDASNLENIDEAIFNLGEQKKELEEKKKEYLDFIAEHGIEIDDNKIAELDKAIATADAELEKARIERERLYGEENAQIYSDTYVETLSSNLSDKMPTTGEEGANYLVDAANGVINAWKLPDKYVDIYARYHGFEGTQPTASYGYNKRSVSSEIQPFSLMSAFAPLFTETEGIAPMSVATQRAVEPLNENIYTSSVLPRIAVNDDRSDKTSNINIKETFNFNTPVEKPSVTARRVREANQDLVKKIK